MAADPHVAIPARKKPKTRPTDPAQLGLFDLESGSTRPPPPEEQATIVSRSVTCAKRVKAPTSVDAVHVVTLGELPAYSAELIEMVDRSIEDLPKDLIWLTYKQIRKHFGISRATIARRLKDGLVPGVRMSKGRMLDDGAVRRFDRTQVRWLLLAVRFGGSAAQSLETAQS